MFYLEDEREALYQWDINRRMVIEDEAINQVHFCNRTDECSLVVECYKENGKIYANIPNILLQDRWDIKVYLYSNGEYTKQCGMFKVIGRTKPTDYVYSETDVLKWDELAEEVKAEVNQALRNTSNALVGTANGTGAVKIDDISPTATNIDVKTNVTTGFKTYGKNLIDYDVNTTEWSVDSGGRAFYFEVPCKSTFSIKRTDDRGTVILYRSTDNFVTEESTAKAAAGNIFKPCTITPEYKYKLYATKSAVDSKLIEWMQVEAGTEGTEYEPYKEPVDNIAIIQPTTTIVADTPGVEIEATYNRDINKAFAELQNALISMGGNV